VTVARILVFIVTVVREKKCLKTLTYTTGIGYNMPNVIHCL